MKLLKTTFILAALAIAGTAFGQGNDCQGKFGQDSATDVKNISMFNQYLQQKDYAAAFPYWKYLISNIPCYSKHITYYGPTIVKYKMRELRKENEEEYEARKEGLIDSVMLSYDLRSKFWGSEGYVLGRKANDWANLRPNDRKAAIEMFEKSIEMEGKKTDDLIPMYYLDAAIDEHKRDRYTLDSLYILYFRMQELVDYNLKNNAKAKDDWIRTDTTMARMMKPYLTCEKIIEYFKPKTDSEPTEELLLKVSGLLEAGECTKEEYYNEVAIKLYKMNPSSQAALAIARSFHSKREMNSAKEYYLKGVDGMDNANEKAEVFFTIARITFDNGDCVGAKNYAEKALAANPNHGNAHLIIANCYAKALTSCSADGIDGRSVFWPAVDRAYKAKSVDPSVEEKANEMISKFSANFPEKGDAFFKGFTKNEGEAYTVPCLGVSTTVRYKN
ncbi:MAG: hypothetical protein H6608_05165 [Flavobacteriales bacterium]|nr:hypothetical protein [Bacteroidota bacterium]MCB9240494.1 hypothetical protein [Flavobacteriales bacterium]